MIHHLLQTLAEKMNEYLVSYYNRPEIIAEAGMINAEPQEDQSDKIILTLLNISRETAMGIQANYRSGAPADLNRQSPPWYLNIDIMIAAIFAPKNYGESLKLLSDSISFLQQTDTLVLPDGTRVTLEPVNLSTQELSNVWSILGGHYYPSVLCRVRMLTFDGTEIKQSSRRITRQSVN